MQEKDHLQHDSTTYLASSDILMGDGKFGVFWTAFLKRALMNIGCYPSGCGRF